MISLTLQKCILLGLFGIDLIRERRFSNGSSGEPGFGELRGLYAPAGCRRLFGCLTPRSFSHPARSILVFAKLS
jgi:hypothetical protein